MYLNFEKAMHSLAWSRGGKD